MKKGYLEYNMFVCVRGQPSLSKKNAAFTKMKVRKRSSH